jgi:hypothetical protein
VTPDDKQPTEEPHNRTWLKHKDCVSLVKACIDAKEVPNRYVIIYGVSNNEGRFHDYRNPFGWKPE